MKKPGSPIRYARPLAPLALTLGVFLVIGCSSPSPGSGVAPSASATLSGADAQTMVFGLCDARRLAGSDPAGASRAFYDRSHLNLHVLAARVQTLDRALAARLLEAKNAVENDLRAQTATARLAPDLDGLLEAVRTALQRVQRPAPACTPESP